jgi:hypothetical protein
MADIKTLAGRIDAEFSAVAQKVKKAQTGQLEEQRQRQQRLARLVEVFGELSEVWRPRLDLLVAKFGDRVQVKPRVVPSTREVTLEFLSRVARVRLKLSAFTDRDVTKVILSYDLEIVPVVVRYEPHAELEFPLGAVDKEAVTKWVDDRLVGFVQTYFSLGETDIYLKDEMVEDPIARISFPRVAAAGTLEWQGQTVYFIDDHTRREFAANHKIAIK